MTLPDGAAAIVARIEALLNEAQPLVAHLGSTDAASYALGETRARYLPDTLRAYGEIPPSLRGERDAAGKTADERLIDQLELLERATSKHLRDLGARNADAVAANGAFLTERFGAKESLPDAVAATPTDAPPAVLVRSLFGEIERAAGPRADNLVITAAERLGALVPQLVTVRRGMFGMGAVEGFSLDIPVRGSTLRYSLATARGSIEASCTKVVRGVALRTEVVRLDEWLAGLYEDLGAFVESDRHTRDTLTRFLEH